VVDRRRRMLLVPLGAAAVLLAIASVAWACTIVRGQTVVNVGSLSGGDRCAPGHTSGPAVHTNTNCATTEAWAGVSSMIQMPGYRQYWHYEGVKGGDTFTATGVGAQGNTRFGLYFLNHWRDSDTMLICMGRPAGRLGPNTQKISGTNSATSSSTGAIGSLTGTIPSGAQATNGTTGPAAVCHISEDTNGNADFKYGTNPWFFTVLP
jgi:hypothetical protein